ncbi:MAG: hypothetical protein WEB90_00480 [Gemmatimonadota bacterium]
MSLELWVTLVAVLVSGGAVGSAGTLLAQWLLRRLDTAPSGGAGVGTSEVTRLRAEVIDLSRHVHNLEARLDFTERLLDGALPLAPAPARIQAIDAAGAEARDETEKRT